MLGFPGIPPLNFLQKGITNRSDLSREDKKRVMLLSCRGGNGHQSATDTITSLFQGIYSTKIVYPMEVLQLGEYFSGVGMYNFLLQKYFLRTVSLMAALSYPVFRNILRGTFIRYFEDQIKRFRPDLIISVMPFINEPALIAAQRAKIPFLLVTVDNDLRNYFVDRDVRSLDPFKVTIGHELPTTTGLLLEKGIASKDIMLTGLPLRRGFRVEKPDRAELCIQLSLPEDKPIILIMMGGACSYKADEYAEHLIRSDLGVHVVVVCGKNRKLLVDMIEKDHPFITPLGFISNISDYMAVASLLITKPGPNTVEEAIQSRLPMLLDTENILSWEESSVELVLEANIGKEIASSEKLDVLVKHMLDHQKDIKSSFDQFQANSFAETIVEVSKELLG